MVEIITGMIGGVIGYLIGKVSSYVMVSMNANNLRSEIKNVAMQAVDTRVQQVVLPQIIQSQMQEPKQESVKPLPLNEAKYVG